MDQRDTDFDAYVAARQARHAWLSAAKIGRVDHIAAETAQVCVLVDSVLAVRRGIRELPKRDRPLITDLVA